MDARFNAALRCVIVAPENREIQYERYGGLLSLVTWNCRMPLSALDSAAGLTGLLGIWLLDHCCLDGLVLGQPGDDVIVHG